MNHRLQLLAIVATLFTPLACGDGGDADSDAPSTTSDATTDEPGATTGAPTTGEPDATTGSAVDFYACEEAMFAGSPLAGPLYDADKGGIQGELQGEYVLHTTQIYVKPERAEKFIELAQKIGGEAQAIDGLIAFSVGSDSGCGVARTMGIWASEEAMYKLVASPAHAEAMGLTTELSYTGRVTHWKATAAEADAYTWDVARARIEPVVPSAIYE
jgi:heme-degrading monooxygenase HmoA